MPETIIDALVRVLRRQAAAGTRSAMLSADTRAAMAAAGSSRAPARPRPPPSRQPVPPRQVAPPRQVVPAPPPPAGPPAAAAPTPVDAAALASLGWEELRARVRECQACALCAERTQTVFGDGNHQAELMFIGEGPGRDEDAQGIPFVGAAGQLLTRMITAMQFERSDVYIANIVKCRPPRNRVPEASEAQACLPYLRRQIELLRPKIIVTLGAIPLQFLLGKSGISRERGTWSACNDIPAMPTYHPAHLLRAPEHKRDVWADLRQVMVRLGKDPAATPRRPPAGP